MNLYDKASLLITPNAYKAGKIYAAKPTSGLGDLTFARASAQTRRNVAGVLENLANNVPALDYPAVGGCPWWNFPVARTNGAINNTFVGAVAGTPGTLPTDLGISSIAGLSQQIAGVGVENGIPYIDLRFFGTASGTFVEIRTSGIAANAALSGQTWTSSIYLKLVSGSYLSTDMVIYERTSGGSFINNSLKSITGTSSLQRFDFTKTLNGGGTTAFANTSLALNVTNGASYDFTIRIGGGQFELGAYASPVIFTSGTALTRVIANPNTSGLTSFIGQTSGTWYTEFRTQSVIPASGDLVSLGGGTANNVVFFVSGSTLRVNICHNSAIILVNSGIKLAANTVYKCAIRYQSGNILLSVNGSSFTSVSTFAFTGALNVLTYTSGNFIGERYPCLFGENSFYPALTNAELVALTTRP